jgi:hypothetical protein
MPEPKSLLGLMKCPECGFNDAEVKADKSGQPYRFCPECTAQYFTRGGVKAKNMLAAMRPLQPVTVTIPASPQPAAAQPDTASPPSPKKRASCLLDEEAA